MKCFHRTLPLLTITLALVASLVLPTAISAIEPSVSDPAWIEFVRPLMTADEIGVFRSLQHRYHQTEFAERFWQSRDPDPSTPRNELRQRWPERLGVVEKEFSGVDTDRGRAFLLAGPPAFILSDLCPEILRPIEIWFYDQPRASSQQERQTLVFFKPSVDDEPQLWDPAAKTVAHLLLQTPSRDASPERLLTRSCKRSREVFAALNDALEREEALRTSDGGDWLELFRHAISQTLGSPLESELSFAFPGSLEGLTEIDAVLSILTSVPPAADGGRAVTVDGDIFRGERRADHFRYRFDLPSTSSHDPITLTFRRHLAPGNYRIVLSAHDLGSGRSGLIEQALQVPSPVASRLTATGGPEDVSIEAGASFKIQPLPLGLLTGRQRVEIATSNERIGDVLFLLDGRQVMKKGRPPFSVELDLGPKPRTHTLEAIAHDVTGAEIARDSVQMNIGPHRFNIRLVEPRQGARYRNSLEVHADVDVPPGETLDRVELFFNETRVATFYQSPFIQPHLLLPERNAAGYVRAVAILDDGNSAEDLAVINTGNSVDSLQVDFVEVYAGVVDRKGAPVTDLTRSDFKVLEDGAHQSIRRFETVRDLPINAMVVLDTSESMIEEIDEARDGAERFFENVLRPRDRAAVVVFSDQPELKVPLTGDLKRLAAGLAEIEAGGETTLYDSVVFGLYYLVGLRGKRALVVLTDGADSQSRYSLDDMLDFARFSGVAVYPIGIGISSRDFDSQRVLRRLASETGGDCYFIDGAGELRRIYSRIENELRSQYLIGYQSTSSARDDFRRIQVEVDRAGLEVKTIPGYYP